ncbi:MAG: hypothetical protein J0G94_13920 [Sphingomonadales bacterium]|nr:hypothetical protein [Sphingomonadales bacterium]
MLLDGLYRDLGHGLLLSPVAKLRQSTPQGKPGARAQARHVLDAGPPTPKAGYAPDKRERDKSRLLSNLAPLPMPTRIG